MLEAEDEEAVEFHHSPFHMNRQTTSKIESWRLIINIILLANTIIMIMAKDILILRMGNALEKINSIINEIDWDGIPPSHLLYFNIHEPLFKSQVPMAMSTKIEK